MIFLLAFADARLCWFLCLFAAPASQVSMSRAVAPNMMAEAGAEQAVTALAAAGTLVAAQAGDFGGYTIPIIGLGLLAAIIAFLAGPVED